MARVQPVDVPTGSLLDAFARQQGVYTDCFAAEIDGAVSLSDFIYAFYTTPLFKAERLLLGLFAKSPSTNDEAQQLASGALDRFAVWQVTERAENELLMRAMGRTSSWLKVQTLEPGNTCLMFGSVVVPVGYPDPEASKMGFGFSTFLGAHKLYSRLLLAAARRQLRRTQNP